MKVVLVPVMNVRRDKSSQWSFFDSKGDLVPIPSLEKLAPQEDVTVSLKYGSYWLLQMNKEGAMVRSMDLIDEYPLSSKETLITYIALSLYFEMRDPDQTERYLREQSNFPEQLIDAIVSYQRNIGGESDVS